MNGAAPALGWRDRLADGVLAQLPLLFRGLRTLWPIPRLGHLCAVTRYDDVREVFLRDADFGVPYRAKLDVMMGGEPFFLGQPDGEAYRRDVAAMRAAVRDGDIRDRLAPATLAAAEAAVRAGGGRIEVVDQLVRRVIFQVFGAYFGVTDPPGGTLAAWADTLFRFQFTDLSDDPALRGEVERIAPQLRAHIDALIAARRAARAAGEHPRPDDAPDDVIERCLALAEAGQPGFETDARIRTLILGCIVGGPPQPPMVVPQALDQLLRRPDALAAAQAAARADDHAALGALVFEAMRFDPLAPAMQRVALRDAVIAPGTPRATRIPAGATVWVAFSSAMMDGRRVPDPRRFDPARLPHESLHFGHGLHACFATAINRVVLPLLLAPLLRRQGLRRVPGELGQLRKHAGLAQSLWVEYQPG